MIFIGGKGHETYQIVGTLRHSFDDRLVVREYFNRLIGLFETSMDAYRPDDRNMFRTVANWLRLREARYFPGTPARKSGRFPRTPGRLRRETASLPFPEKTTTGTPSLRTPLERARAR